MHLHMISSNLVEGAGINDEVGRDFSEYTWKQKSPFRCFVGTEKQDRVCSVTLRLKS